MHESSTEAPMKPKGIRFPEPMLHRLEAIRAEEGHRSVGETVRVAIRAFIDSRDRDRLDDAA